MIGTSCAHKEAVTFQLHLHYLVARMAAPLGESIVFLSAGRDLWRWNVFDDTVVQQKNLQTKIASKSQRRRLLSPLN